MFEDTNDKDSVLNDSLNKQVQYTHKTKGISLFFERVNTLNGLQIISAVLQVFLGLTVVALSLIQFIQPLWIATLMTVIGSVNSMVGLYSLYNQFSRNGIMDSLLHRAIKRVINSQN